jgi:foldase protein PrsA
MITNMIIDQEAKKQHLTATDADIDAKIAEIRTQIKSQMPGQTLEQFVTQSGHTMAELRDNLKTRIEVEKLVSKDIKPAQAVHVRHILIRTENVGAPDPTVKIHTEAEAKQIIDKIQADLKAGKPFADEAKQYTEDPSGKANGGDLPIVVPTSPLDNNFLQAALKLKKGEVTQTPVKSVYGLHLIYAESTSADPTPADKPLYDQALKNYQQQMLGMQIPAYVKTLTDKAKIVNYIEHGVNPPTAPAKKTAEAPAAPAKKAAPASKPAAKPVKAAVK